MRHGRKINHLGRTASHRKALMSNMASSLILHKRINTTVAKAKELRKFVEPLLTRAKQDSTHSRRMVFSYLNNKESVKVLFTEIADRIMDRPGGYTRIIKTGQRLGDNAEMCLMELVDFNDLYTKETGEKKARTRRSRRGSKSTKPAEDQAAAATSEITEAAESQSGENQEPKADKPKAKAKTEKKEAKPAKSASSEKSKAKSSDKKSSAKSDKKDKGGKKGKK
jgi:large subunit ribosomal protein L17